MFAFTCALELTCTHAYTQENVETTLYKYDKKLFANITSVFKRYKIDFSQFVSPMRILKMVQ